MYRPEITWKRLRINKIDIYKMVFSSGIHSFKIFTPVVKTLY